MDFDSCWSPLASIGRLPAGGYRRYAWTPEDVAARAWFADQAKARGMDVEADRNGNLWAWWGGPDREAVVTGSHLDTVAAGGAYDGALGVVSGFCAVDLLRERGFRPGRPIAVTAFSDEEGGRFGVACMGSRLLTGALDPGAARALTDPDGVTLAAAMAAAGADPDMLGRDDEALARLGVYVELHVEQGRALVDAGSAIGVGTGIWPHGRWRYDLRGEANHAGTTRLADRRDPTLVAAALIEAARVQADALGGVATVGRVVVEPNTTNAIPSAASLWLDARAADPARLRAIVDGVTAAAVAAAEPHGVEVVSRAESETPAVVFDEELCGKATAAVRGLGHDAPPLPTAAGHDAGILATAPGRPVPVSMLYVRNPTGVSHSPAEHAERDDCLHGVHALAAVLEELAR
jgi:N-carbamoyl-L-amino-acid hydrolase